MARRLTLTDLSLHAPADGTGETDTAQADGTDASAADAVTDDRAGQDPADAAGRDPAGRGPAGSGRDSARASLASGAAGAVQQRRPAAWWRLRSWKKDQDVLARLREGLAALPDEPEPEPAPVAVTQAGPAGTTVTGTADSAAGWDSGVPDEAGPEGRPPWERAPAPAATGLQIWDSMVPDAAGAAGSPWRTSADAEAAQAALAAAEAELQTAEQQIAGQQTAEQQTAEQAAAEESAAGSSAVGDVPRPTGQADPAIVAMRETFAQVAESGDEAAAYFYGWLFVRHPELRDLFPPAMDGQRDRLLVALTRIVESLSTPEEMASYLAQLGRDHRKYSVQPEMYDAVGEALIGTLRAYAGPLFTPAAEEAWTQTYMAASALMIRASEESAAAEPAYWTAEVVEHEDRGDGIAIITIAPDQVLRYEPGQHLTVQTPRWPHVWRPYSIACRPREDGLIRFHVKAVPGGWVSNALVYHTEPGDELIVGPALGTMTLHTAGERDLLCVAGGTGLSPLKAIIEQAIKQSVASNRRQIYLFYGAKRRSELYDLKDLWRLADAYGKFHLTPVTSDDPAFDGMQGNVGRVAARYMPHGDCEAYVAGPVAMVRETIRVLGKAGIPRERIHFDDTLLAGHKHVGSGM